MINIRLPNITGATEKEQLMQVKSYLHQLVQELNWALSTIETGNSTVVAKTTSGNPVTKEDLDTSFNALKALIIKPSNMTDEPESTAKDFVVEEGTSNGWTYKKWKSGTYEMFGYFTVSPTVAGEEKGNLYYSEQFALLTPFEIDSAVVSGSALNWFIVISGGQASTDPEKNVEFRLCRPTAFDAGISINVRIHVTGKYK